MELPSRSSAVSSAGGRRIVRSKTAGSGGWQTQAERSGRVLAGDCGSGGCMDAGHSS